MILIEPTLGHCLKIWWAFCWRAGVMMMPGLFVLMVSMFFFMPFPEPGKPPDQFDPKAVAAIFAVIYPLMFVVIIGSQVLGLRWMLRAQRWRDFFVALIPAKDPAAELQARAE